MLYTSPKRGENELTIFDLELYNKLQGSIINKNEKIEI